MRKRAFLLLEILIAFVVVEICLIPLVKQPLKLYKEEMNYLETMEMERLADWTFMEVKEILLKNELPWEKIPTRDADSPRFSLPPASLSITGNKPKAVQRSYFLRGRAEKTGRDGTIYRQLGVYIFLNATQYEFRLPVQRLSANPPVSNPPDAQKPPTSL